MMWHEVRRQERKIRCMIVDYKRRAERRKDYYEKIKADPTQFLQVHGRPCKVHLDPTVAAAGDSAAVMMNWAGSPDVVIDRFDVRAHLDHISDSREPDSDHQLTYDERYINYERYRILVQNDFLGVTEEKFLHQLHLEEQYGASTKTGFVPIEGKKKVPGAAIGYVYEDSTGGVSSGTADQPLASASASASAEWKENETNEEVEDDDDSDVDFDVCVDVNQVSTQQAHELNQCSQIYGMEGNDFFSFLTKDKEEADNLRLAKELEEEKAMYSGRKSRRERRAYREKKLAGRKISPPSYASRRSPTYHDYNRQLRSTSKSRSPSPENSGQITFITCFGEEEHGADQPMSSDMRRRSPNQYGADRKQKWNSSKSRQSPQSSHDAQRRVNYSRASGSPGRSRGRRSPQSRSRNYGNSDEWSRSHSPSNQRRSRETRPEVRRSAERRGRRSPRRQSPWKRSRSPEHRKNHGSPRGRRSLDRSFGNSPTSRSPRRWTDSSPSRTYSPQRSAASWSAQSNDIDLDGYGRMSDTGSSHGSSSPPPSKPAFRPRPSTHQQSSNFSSSSTSGASKVETTNSTPSKQYPAIPRYYGRRRARSSSSDEVYLSGDEEKSSTSDLNTNQKVDSDKPTTSMGNAGGRTKIGSFGSSSKMTMQERLKRKMQIMLNRQFKADKRAEKEKQERVYQERIDREDEMREISIKLRKRERMKRHEYYAELERQERRSTSSRSSSSSDRSPPPRREKRRYSRSRSRSRSSEHYRSSRGLVDY